MSFLTFDNIMSSGSDLKKHIYGNYRDAECTVGHVVINTYFAPVSGSRTHHTSVREKKVALSEYRNYGEYLLFNGLSRTQTVLKFLEHVKKAEKELNTYSETAKLKFTEKFNTDIDKKVSLLCREISLDIFKNRYKPINVITGKSRITEFDMSRGSFKNIPFVEYVDEFGRVQPEIFKVLEKENIIPTTKDICYPWVYAFYHGIPFSVFLSFAREYKEDYNRLYGIDMETYLFYRIDGHTPEEIDANKEKIKGQEGGYFLFEGTWYSCFSDCIETLGLDTKEIDSVKKEFNFTTSQAIYYLQDKEKKSFFIYKLSTKDKLTHKERMSYLNQLGIPLDIYMEIRDNYFHGTELNLMTLLIKAMYLVEFDGTIYRNIQEVFDDYGSVHILPVVKNIINGYSLQNSIEDLIS